MSLESSALFLAWVAIVIIALGLSGALRQIRELEARVYRARTRNGPEVGRSAPSIEGWNRDKEARHTIIVFADMGCLTCSHLIPELPALLASANLQRGVSELFGLVVYRESDQVRESLDLDNVKVVADSGAFEAYSIEVVPTAVLIDSNGLVVRAGPIGSVEHFERFVEEDVALDRKEERQWR